jgi:hypothetical protein
MLSSWLSLSPEASIVVRANSTFNGSTIIRFSVKEGDEYLEGDIIDKLSLQLQNILGTFQFASVDTIRANIRTIQYTGVIGVTFMVFIIGCFLGTIVSISLLRYKRSHYQSMNKLLFYSVILATECFVVELVLSYDVPTLQTCHGKTAMRFLGSTLLTGYVQSALLDTLLMCFVYEQNLYLTCLAHLPLRGELVANSECDSHTECVLWIYSPMCDKWRKCDHVTSL